jgi:DNA-directed RNA polymerase subunit M/transcription elongation factor TFIIS
MPISVVCPTCGKNLRAPDKAAGKRAKCPQCGAVLEVPNEIVDAEVVESPANESYELVDRGSAEIPDVIPVADAPAETPEAPPERERRPCPMCGEMILAKAAKCRFCGEVFDDRLVKRRGKMNWLERQFHDTPLFALVLAGMCCCFFGFAFAIAGVASCEEPRAKRNATVMLVVNVVVMGLGLLFFVTMAAWDESSHRR